MGLETLTTNFVDRNVSSTCNSSGTGLWASAKKINPAVDAKFHRKAIEFAYHQSPIRFSPVYYQNPGSMSRSPSGQTILFGYNLELRIVGKQEKIPLVLEYLLDSVRHSPRRGDDILRVSQKHRNYRSHTTHSIISQKNLGLW